MQLRILTVSLGFVNNLVMTIYHGDKFLKPPVERQLNRNAIRWVSPRRRSHSNQSWLTNGKGEKKMLRVPKSIRDNITVTPWRLKRKKRGLGDGGVETFSILTAGTGLSLRNLGLWWDSPRLSAGTSAGRRSATVALCNSSIKPQGKLCVQPLARASTVRSQAVAHLLRTSSPQA